MTPSRPYLFRALFDWILDNSLTPYVVINALDPDAMVPMDYVNDGRITLNVTPGIVSELEMNNTFIRFTARFGGVATTVYAPMRAVMVIYAKENGRGMVFPEEPEEEYPEQNPSTEKTRILSAVESQEADIAESKKNDQYSLSTDKNTKNKKGKPKLRIVK